MLKHFVAGLLIVHGAIHAMGFVWAWNLAEIGELSGPTFLFPGRGPGDPTIIALGGIWLLATIMLIAAGIAVTRRSRLSLPLAGVAAGISLVVTIIWWEAASVGAVVSALILTVAIVRGRLHTAPVPVPEPTAEIFVPQWWRSTL